MAAPKQTVYERITATILARMEEGDIPWRRTWSPEAGMPRNIRGTNYRGINVFLLGSLGYESPTFLTFKQAQAKGGCVRKGEKGCPVVFWKWLDKADKETGEQKRIPLLRGYTVFNVAQCDEVADPFGIDEDTRPTIDPIEVCEKMVESYAGAPSVEHGGGRACYSPLTDGVRMPSRDSFESSEAYYSTLFHELGHSTGHHTRLKRDGVTNHASFGNHSYAKEELVAEFCASFLCGVAGIARPETVDNSAAYLQSWMRALRKDPKLLVQGAAAAQRAADWIQGKRYEQEKLPNTVVGASAGGVS